MEESGGENATVSSRESRSVRRYDVNTSFLNTGGFSKHRQLSGAEKKRASRRIKAR